MLGSAFDHHCHKLVTNSCQNSYSLGWQEELHHNLTRIADGVLKDMDVIEWWAVSHTKHIWYSGHGTYHRFEIILERVMSVTHVAVIPCMRTGPDEEEFLKNRLS